MEIDRSLIGSVSDSYHIIVERGAITKFAAAIGDSNAIFHDEDAARAQGFAGIVAPPTFPVSFIPPQEPIWTRVLDRRRILAGEQAFRYVRPIIAGDRLTCRIRFVDVVDKEGRSGKMELLVQEVRGTDEEGEDVFFHTRTTVYRGAGSRLVQTT
jgi:acyl dehydratase